MSSILTFLNMQFYKNLATGLKDIVWQSGDEVKDNEVNSGMLL